MRKFKVGDMVKIVNYQYGNPHTIELLGKIVKIDALIASHWYQADGWDFREDWLELVYTRESIEELL